MFINNFSLTSGTATSYKKNNESDTFQKSNSTVRNRPKNPGDSAEISVTAKMTARLNGLHQALHNIRNGYTFVNIANGHLSQIQHILQKIRTISVKSAQGTYTLNDRQMLQVEVSALIDEVDRIASQAEYGDFYFMLEGYLARGHEWSSMWFHIGSGMHERERIYIQTMTARGWVLKTLQVLPYQFQHLPSPKKI